jgi:RND superfamily putative drug exporter
MLARDFEGTPTPPAQVAVTFPTTMSPQDQQAAASEYATRIGGVPGVESAQVAGIADHTARVVVFYPGDPLSADSQLIVERIRQVPAPAQAHALVGGPTAELADLLSSLGSRLPWMALILVGTTLVLLFLAFGSVVLPVKAVVMNVLSLGATFGALVLIFQDGHLSSFLHFTPTGTIEATQPVLMLAIAFGLSMDYEVFLLSRVREQYDLTHDNSEAVATGLQHTGRIITSAALLLVIVIGAFSTSGITFIKLIGVGMIIAIVVDATLVRALLVPATMRLMGDLNWYAPGPLRRVYARFGVREGGDPAAAAASSSRRATRRRTGRHRTTADAPPSAAPAMNRAGG